MILVSKKILIDRINNLYDEESIKCLSDENFSFLIKDLNISVLDSFDILKELETLKNNKFIKIFRNLENISFKVLKNEKSDHVNLTKQEFQFLKI